jgi:hypothetical protein
VASPYKAARALFPACLSTVHAHRPCSQTFRAPSSLNACTPASVAAPTRPRHCARRHSCCKPMQTTQVCYACRELPLGPNLVQNQARAAEIDQRRRSTATGNRSGDPAPPPLARVRCQPSDPRSTCEVSSRVPLRPEPFDRKPMPEIRSKLRGGPDRQIQIRRPKSLDTGSRVRSGPSRWI